MTNHKLTLRALGDRGIVGVPDYDVLHQDVSIGRIHQTIVAGGKKAWSWSVAVMSPGKPMSTSGNADTREAAMAEVRANFDRFEAMPNFDFQNHARLMREAQERIAKWKPSGGE